MWKFTFIISLIAAIIEWLCFSLELSTHDNFSVILLLLAITFTCYTFYAAYKLFQSRIDPFLTKFFLGAYTYSMTNTVETFDVNKYKDVMEIRNTHYVYDSEGRIMAVICADTVKKTVWMCKKYIVMKRLGLIPVIYFINQKFALVKSLASSIINTIKLKLCRKS